MQRFLNRAPILLGKEHRIAALAGVETVHLLRSPANAAHLQRSLEQAERGELLSRPLIDTDPIDADQPDADPLNADPLDAGS